MIDAAAALTGFRHFGAAMMKHKAFLLGAT